MKTETIKIEATLTGKKGIAKNKDNNKVVIEWEEGFETSITNREFENNIQFGGYKIIS